MMRLALLFSAILLSGCYDSFDVPAVRNSDAPEPNITISKLTSLYTDKTIIISEDAVISGYVSSSDAEGNFYRTLTIEDSGHGAEIMAGVDHLCNLYPPGYKLTVKLKGLAIGKSYGILQIGLPPESYSNYAVEYISAQPFLDRIIFVNREKCDVKATERSISILNKSMCGSLVKICSMTYSPKSEEQNTWSGYKRFTDHDGNEIYCYTSDYASYAGKEISTGTVSLTGILQYGKAGSSGQQYIIKMRGVYDCIKE